MANHELPRDALTPLLPALLAEAAYATGDVGTYLQFLEERQLVEQAVVVMYSQHTTNSWDAAEGDYRHPSSQESIKDAPLSGLEKLWESKLDELLAKKPTSNNPALFVEFGSGFGISAIRLGAQDKYRRAIETGEILLAATNLGYTPPKITDADGYTGVANSLNARNKQNDEVVISPEDLAFIQANQHRVQFVEASVMTLGDIVLRGGDSQPVPAKGNVAIITERHALMHSHIPDIAMGIFASLLQPGGTLYLDTKRPNYMALPSFREIQVADGRTIALAGPQGHEYHDHRKRALEIGVAAAHYHLGLEVVEDTALGPMVLAKRQDV